MDINMFNKKGLLIIESCLKYFKTADIAPEKLLDYLSGTKTSLRFLEWFIHTICKEVHPDIYKSYKDHINVYQKDMFDIFCRKYKIKVNIHNHTILTTPGQLNFFKWFVKNDIEKLLDTQLANAVCVE
jgi:hypothetical protein